MKTTETTIYIGSNTTTIIIHIESASFLCTVILIKADTIVISINSHQASSRPQFEQVSLLAKMRKI